MEQIGKIQGTLEGVQEDVKHIKKEIYGNGQPGMRDELTRTEEAIKNIAGMMQHNYETGVNDIGELKKMMIDLTCNVSNLTKTVEKHVENKEAHIDPERKVNTLKSLFLNKESLIYVIIGFLALHALVPQFDLIETIKKLLGL